MSFRARLDARWDKGLFVCVGLDPVWDRLPVTIAAAAGPKPSRAIRAAAMAEFCRAIVSATAPFACAFKPNAAFFEAEGTSGFEALESVVRHIQAVAPDVPVIYDAKRGDIGSTNQGYADHAFDQLGADAITVHPYLGQEALQPFLGRRDKGTIVLVRTSNPGGGEFQDLAVGGEPLYRVVARRIADHWNGHRQLLRRGRARPIPRRWRPCASSWATCRSSSPASALRAVTCAAPSKPAATRGAAA